MPRRCLKCDAQVTPREQGRPVGVSYTEPDGTPISLVVLYECFCGSHQSVVLWQDEEMALGEHEEALAAEQYERDFGAADRADTRGFFSTAAEFEARGL